MTDDVCRRLLAQTLLLSSLRSEAGSTAHDDLLADAERIHLRPLEEAAKELLRRLQDQSEAQAGALKHAANVRRNYADVVHGEASVGVELDHILSAPMPATTTSPPPSIVTMPVSTKNVRSCASCSWPRCRALAD